MIVMFSTPGQHHLSRDEENQDIICHDRNDRFAVITLADGVSSCKKARVGAEIASRAITHLFLENGPSFMQMSATALVHHALNCVLYQLRAQAQKDGLPVEEYASTLSSVLIDRDKKELRYFHLGDGMILGLWQGRCRTLALPSDCTEGCYVTTTRNVAHTVATAQMAWESMSGIMILSDGAWRQMVHRGRLLPQVKKLLDDGDYAGLNQYLTQAVGFDDCSCICLQLDKEGGNPL